MCDIVSLCKEFSLKYRVYYPSNRPVCIFLDDRVDVAIAALDDGRVYMDIRTYKYTFDSRFRDAFELTRNSFGTSDGCRLMIIDRGERFYVYFVCITVCMCSEAEYVLRRYIEIVRSVADFLHRFSELKRL